MRWWSLLLASALLVGSCTSAEPPARSATTARPQPSAVPTTAGVEAASPAIDVLRTVDPSIGARMDELANFGYYGRPAPSTNPLVVPELASRFPALAVEAIELSWGIDSAAVAVVADGPATTIADAEDWLTASTDWMVAGEGWLAALYRGGLAADFEMDDLSTVITSIMAPDEAGDPPPPPFLIVDADSFGPTTPFDVVTIEGATAIQSGPQRVAWIADGTGHTSWDASMDPADIHDLGAAELLTSIGCFAFVIGPGATPADESSIAQRHCVDSEAEAIWPIPPEWEVTGLAIVGTFGQDDYRLIVTAEGPGERPPAVAVTLDDRFADPATPPPDPVSLESLAPLNPQGHRWSLPHRSTTGGLLVVEERADGWYLIDDALDDSRDLLSASAPIIAHTVDAGNRNIVVVVNGPVGPSTWWIRDDEVVELGGTATSVAWAGSHSS